MRFPLAVLIAALAYAFTAWRLIAPLHLGVEASLAAAALFLGLFLTVVIYPLGWFGGGRLRTFARRPLVRRISYFGMAFGSILFTTIIWRDALWLTIGWLFAKSIDLERWSSIAAFGLAIAMFGWGWIQVRLGPRTKRVRVAVADLPSSLCGFRIVQLSDLHIGERVRREQIEKLAERVNALEADIVAITGDLVDGSVADLGWHAAPLANLTSKHGTFFVPGNHEHYSGIGEWLVHLERLGWNVLVNAHRSIGEGRGLLVVAGVDDFGASRDPAADVALALRGAPDAAIRILLAHHPKTALFASKEDIDLQLSGHTHGGQFVPWTFAARFVHVYNAGLYKVGRMWLYVSRGTFFWGPPIRVMAPAEVTVIELRAAEPRRAV